MALIELLPDTFVPTSQIAVNGRKLHREIANAILDVSVTEHLSPPSQFSFRLNDPKLELIDKQTGLFNEGTRVEISLGFIGHTRKMIVGEVSALTADYPNSGPASLQVEGFDLMHRLTRGTIYRMFGGPDPGSGVPDSKIVSDIAREANLSASVDQTPARNEPRVQNHKTNLAFLEELAEDNGCYLWMEEGTLNFKSEAPALKTVRLEWGKTLMSFSPRLSTAGQVNAVEVRGWDPIQKQKISARVRRSGAAAGALAATGREQLAQGAGGRSERVIEDAHITTAQEAEALAGKLLAEQTQSLITGSGTSPGPPGIRPGTILNLTKLGRFSGSYRVTQVTHSLDSSGYRTSFQVQSL